jgi:hypothetical protein
MSGRKKCPYLRSRSALVVAAHECGKLAVSKPNLEKYNATNANSVATDLSNVKIFF